MPKRRSMTNVKTALAVVAVTLLSAHVAPSVDDNNRYLKVTPQADGVRLAYTGFFGEISIFATRGESEFSFAPSAIHARRMR